MSATEMSSTCLRTLTLRVRHHLASGHPEGWMEDMFGANARYNVVSSSKAFFEPF